MDAPRNLQPVRWAAGISGRSQGFRDWAKDQPLPKITLTTGWHEIIPELSEQLLICNTRNRKMRYPDVLRYATQMANKQWKKTGEPIIITDQGIVEDAGHRLTASYFGNVPFESFVVCDVPHDDNLFAYIDNGVSRTGEDTLQAAGINGLSPILTAVIKQYAIHYDEGNLTFAGRGALSPITNMDILNYSRNHPSLQVVARLVQDLYQGAAKRLDEKTVTTFLAWKVYDAHGSGVLEDFMSLITQADLPQGHPVGTLQQRLDQHFAAKEAAPRSAKAKLKMKNIEILVFAMRAFIAWQQGKLNVPASRPAHRRSVPQDRGAGRRGRGRAGSRCG